MKHCKVCGSEISEGRRNALPKIDTCVEHSDAEQVAGYMSWEGKTAAELNIVSQEEGRRAYELRSKRLP